MLLSRWMWVLDDFAWRCLNDVLRVCFMYTIDDSVIEVPEVADGPSIGDRRASSCISMKTKLRNYKYLPPNLFQSLP